MKSKGLSLLEVTIVMVISSILGLAIAVNFVFVEKLRSTTEEKIALTREARIAMNHMARVLRGVKVTEPVTAGPDQITATIEGGYLSFIPSDATVSYTRNTTDNTLEYTLNGSTSVIAGAPEKEIYITYFEGRWDGSKFEIKLKAEKGDLPVFLRTKIMALGGITPAPPPT